MSLKTIFLYVRLDIYFEEIFSNQFEDAFKGKDYPKLIGVMDMYEGRENGSLRFRYKPTLLLDGNTLVATGKLFNEENVLEELKSFKEKCDENEKELVSMEFVHSIPLSKRRKAKRMIVCNQTDNFFVNIPILFFNFSHSF